MVEAKVLHLLIALSGLIVTIAVATWYLGWKIGALTATLTLALKQIDKNQENIAELFDRKVDDVICQERREACPGSEV